MQLLSFLLLFLLNLFHKDGAPKTIARLWVQLLQLLEAEITKFTPQEMREYEASKMAYRDIKNSIDTAKQEGKNEKALEIAKNMLADGVDINLIKKYSGLSQEQIKKMK